MRPLLGHRTLSVHGYGPDLGFKLAQEENEGGHIYQTESP